MIILFLYLDSTIVIGDNHYHVSECEWNQMKRICNRLWQEGKAISSPFQGGFGYQVI